MSARRRLSESISEGDGISLLVQVTSEGDIAAAEASGAEGLAVSPDAESGIAGTSPLPVVMSTDSPEEARTAGADAWLLVAERYEDRLEEHYSAAQALGLECVVDVQDDDELRLVLESIAPEIILLSARGAGHEEDSVDRVLELLPDVPAGMLAIAELRGPTADAVVALERAGVDAILVDVADLDAVTAPAP